MQKSTSPVLTKFTQDCVTQNLTRPRAPHPLPEGDGLEDLPPPHQLHELLAAEAQAHRQLHIPSCDAGTVKSVSVRMPDGHFAC